MGLLKKLGKLAAGAVTGGVLGGVGVPEAAAQAGTPLDSMESAVVALFAAIGGVVAVWMRERSKASSE